MATFLLTDEYLHPSSQPEATGYLHELYCRSLGEFGAARFLSHCRGWILERAIPNSSYLDAMGCYPMFACQDWSQLPDDMDRIGNSLVCFSIVADPFGDYDAAYLRQCFPDVAVPFKDHFVIDLRRPLQEFVHPHHLRNARKALGDMTVEKCARPATYLEEWIGLYGELTARHDIKGVAAFSRGSFARQLNVPGIVAFRAIRDNVTLGMLLWFVQENRAYYHLGAYSSAGYGLGASFALFRYSLDYFALQGFRWLNLGAGAGTTDAESGLTRFKRGWSTGTRTAYFCGRIFNRQAYDEIVAARGLPPTNYFPAYRAGEFD